MKTTKRILMLILSLSIITSSVNFSFAQENNFNHTLIETITIPIEDNNILTVKEMHNLLYQNGGKKVIPSKADTQESVSVREFLDEFIFVYEGQYIHKKDENYIYPAKNSIIITKDDWNYLMDNLDKPMKLDLAKEICENIENAGKILKDLYAPLSYDDYHTIIENFYPEFLEMTENNKEAISFWINPDPESHITVWHSKNLSTIMHEVHHEESAKRSRTFKNRKITDSTWEVNWSEKPSTYYFYSLKNSEWVNGKTIPNYPEGSIIMFSVPNEIKKLHLYETYYKNTNSASRIQAIYGMLNELISSTIELRMIVVASSIEYHYERVPSMFFEDCYFHMGVILEYLKDLHLNYKNTYDKLMKDDTLMSLIKDTYNYIEEQKNTAVELEEFDEDVETILDWVENNIKYFKNIKEEIDNGGIEIRNSEVD